jgi:hypothetical protein
VQSATLRRSASIIIKQMAGIGRSVCAQMMPQNSTFRSRPLRGRHAAALPLERLTHKLQDATP